MKRRTLGFELMLCSEIDDQFGGSMTGSALAHARPLYPPSHLRRSHARYARARVPRWLGRIARRQAARGGSLDDSVVYFVLTLRQRCIQHVLFLGRKCSFDTYLETPEKEWAENLAHSVDKHGIARFGGAFEKGRSVGPV